MVSSVERAFKALAREGIAARKEGPVYRVKLAEAVDAPEAEVLCSICNARLSSGRDGASGCCGDRIW